MFVGHCPNREVYQAWHDIPSATGLLKAQKRCGADLHQQKGYEPNALRPRNCAMASRRVQSVPGGGMVNPFWSTRAREGFEACRSPIGRGSGSGKATSPWKR